MFESNPSSGAEFAASVSDEDEYVSHTTDSLSTDNESCSTCQDSPPKNGDFLVAQKDEPSSKGSSSAHVGDSQFRNLSSSSQDGNSPSSVSDTFNHLANGTILCDLGGCGPPRKKAKVDSSKKSTCNDLPVRRNSPPVKRANHPAIVTDILTNWMLQHLEFPYPTEKEKKEISEVTQLTLTQVNDWMINTRKRHYLEWCCQHGVDPIVIKRNRKGSNGQSKNKENDDPCPVSDAATVNMDHGVDLKAWNRSKKQGMNRTVKRNRRGSNGSRSFPKLVFKENDDPCLYDSGLKQNLYDDNPFAGMILLSDTASTYTKLAVEEPKQGMKNEHLVDPVLVKRNSRCPNGEQSSSTKSKNTESCPVYDSGLNRNVFNVMTFVSLTLLADVSSVYEESQKLPRKNRLSQVEWIKERLCHD